MFWFFFFLVKSSCANHWLLPVSNKPEFTIPINIIAVTDVVLKSQSQLQLASEASVIQPDYFIYVIVILEDTLVLNLCCLILSGSPVPIAEMYLPELLSVEIPTHILQELGIGHSWLLQCWMPELQLSWRPQHCSCMHLNSMTQLCC